MKFKIKSDGCNVIRQLCAFGLFTIVWYLTCSIEHYKKCTLVSCIKNISYYRRQLPVCNIEEFWKNKTMKIYEIEEWKPRISNLRWKNSLGSNNFPLFFITFDLQSSKCTPGRDISESAEIKTQDGVHG